jgi:hypothetical protein
MSAISLGLGLIIVLPIIYILFIIVIELMPNLDEIARKAADADSPRWMGKRRKLKGGINEIKTD